MKFVPPLVSVLLLSGAAALPPPVTGVELCRDVPDATCAPFERIDSGTFSQTWGYHTIQTPEEWESFWSAHGRIDEPPAVEFGTHWIAALVLNYHTCCHPTQILEVRHVGAAYVVSYWSQPIGVLQTFSEPYDIVKVERADALPVVALFAGPPSPDPPHHGPV